MIIVIANNKRSFIVYYSYGFYFFTTLPLILQSNGKRGGGASAFLSLSACCDSSIRFGVLNVLYNLSTTQADLEGKKKDKEREVDALRAAAQKGLPGGPKMVRTQFVLLVC